MDSLDSTYRCWFLANPKAFVEGVRGFQKQAAADGRVDTENSLWRRIKPWLLLLGVGGLALKGGEQWGRFAQTHDYPQGPVTGPIAALLGAMLPERYKIQGTKTRAEAAGPSPPPFERGY